MGARLLAVLLLVAACSGGDGEDASGCAGVEAGEARVDLGERWYLRTAPGDTGSARLPLVVDLHGYSEGAERHAEVTRFGPLGEDEGFVTVTPHGAGDPPHWDLAADGRDVAFVEDVIDDARRRLCVDPDRVYVTGSSMGGFLTSVVACELGDRLAAVATVAGLAEVRDCAGWHPLPVLAVHATGDDAVRYDGGLSPRVADALGLPETGPAVPALVRGWATKNGCATEPDTQRDGDVTVIRFPCPAGGEVVHRRIDGGGHDWPTSATEDIWRFFETAR